MEKLTPSQERYELVAPTLAKAIMELTYASDMGLGVLREDVQRQISEAHKMALLALVNLVGEARADALCTERT